MSKKETRLFNPVRVKRKIGFKTILPGFIAFVLVISVAGVIYISINGTSSTNKYIRKIGAFLDSKNASDNAEADNAKQFEGINTNILLMSVSSSKTQETGQREIYFLVLAHADAGEGQIKFCPLKISPDYLVKYEQGGEAAVTAAVSDDYDIPVEKYISSDENTFALAINYMGGLEYNIRERVEYRTPDLTLILTPGKQNIKGEVLIKYLKYCKENDLSMQGKIFTAMINEYLTKENFEDAMKKYAGILDSLSGNSNISYVDTADNLKNIEPIVNSSEKAKAVNSVEELK